MSRRVGWNVILAIAFGPALVSLGSRSAFSADGPAGNVPAREWKGIGGCASTACHNAGLATGSYAIKRNEYSIWVSSDRHQYAYAVLLEPLETDRKPLSTRQRPVLTGEGLALPKLPRPSRFRIRATRPITASKTASAAKAVTDRRKTG